MIKPRTVRGVHIPILIRAIRLFAGLALCLPMASAVGAGENEWTSIGPEGGRVSALAIDPLTPQVLYVGTQRGGVFKSENGGETWTASGLRETLFPRLLVHPQDSQTLYALAEVYSKTGPVPPSLFRSQEGGKNWEVVMEGTNIFAVALDPEDPHVLYGLVAASTGTSVQKSEDGGQNWLSIGTDLPYASTIVIDTENSQLLYVGTQEGVFRSENGGEDWTAAKTGLPSSQQEVFALAMAPQNPSVLYASTYGGGVYKTEDRGEIWTSIDTGLPNSSETRIVPDPHESQRLYATTHEGLYRSEDGGESWTVAGLTATSALVVHPRDPQRLYAATEIRGVYASADGGTTWRPINSGLVATWVSHLAFDEENPERLYANTSSGINMTEDGGDSWTASASETPDFFRPDVVVDPANPQTMYRAELELSKSEDGGQTWTRLNLEGFVWAMLIDPHDSQILYAFGDFPLRNWFASGIARSDDGGGTWTYLTNGLPETWYGVDALTLANTMVIDPANSQLYAGTGLGVYTSEDRGEHWTPTGLTSGFVKALLIDPQNPLTLIAGTDQGVYRSMDGGTEWTAINSGLTNTFISAVTVDPKDRQTLYAGTEGGGVFRITLSDDTAILVDAVADLPDFFQLHQNVPNPFNSTTVIRIALPERGVVDLSVYNLAGQKVVNLVQGVWEAGTYAVDWDGRDDGGRTLASGAYIYRLQTGEHAVARKLALVR